MDRWQDATVSKRLHRAPTGLSAVPELRTVTLTLYVASHTPSAPFKRPDGPGWVIVVVRCAKRLTSFGAVHGGRSDGDGTRASLPGPAGRRARYGSNGREDEAPVHRAIRSGSNGSAGSDTEDARVRRSAEASSAPKVDELGHSTDRTYRNNDDDGIFANSQTVLAKGVDDGGGLMMNGYENASDTRN